MPGRILLTTLLALLLLGAATASASERSQARAVGEALRPLAAAIPEIDLGVAASAGNAGDAAVARCGASAAAVGKLPRTRRASVATGLGLLQLGLDTLPATLQVLVPALAYTQDQLQDVTLRSRVLKSARAARQSAIERLATIARGRESLCPILAPWAQAGFPTTRKAPSFRRIQRANRRAASAITGSEQAFDGDREKKRAAGAKLMRRTGISRRVTRALTLSFRIPATSAAVAADPFREALRRAAGGK